MVAYRGYIVPYFIYWEHIPIIAGKPEKVKKMETEIYTFNEGKDTEFYGLQYVGGDVIRTFGTKRGLMAYAKRHGYTVIA